MIASQQGARSPMSGVRLLANRDSQQSGLSLAWERTTLLSSAALYTKPGNVLTATTRAVNPRTIASAEDEATVSFVTPLA